MFPWDSTSPAEHAARIAHTVMASSFAEYRYSDEALQAWIDEFHRILGDSKALEAARAEHLTEEERQRIERELSDRSFRDDPLRPSLQWLQEPGSALEAL